MTSSKKYARIFAPAALLLLAACQTVPTAPVRQTETQVAPVATTTSTPAKTQGAPVVVFVATHQIQPGWTPVAAPSGTLYVNPKPFLTRADLNEVKAGGASDGKGWLALSLNPEGAKKVLAATNQHPGKGLALVIGRTMMPLMRYSAPIQDGQLVFYVSNEANAIAAARAIAGVPASAATENTAIKP